MSAERIREAALARFAGQGYDAASLAEIAADVGIKPPSIYAHFPGKEALFWQLVEQAADRELALVRESLRRPLGVGEAMRGYLYGTVERFTADQHLRFWLRCIYLPPPGLQGKISVHDRRFALALEEIVGGALRHPDFGLKEPALPFDSLAAAFIGMLRGIHAELLYCGDSDTRKTLAAMWAVFELALRGAEPV